MADLTLAIMAHPVRKVWAEGVQAALDRPATIVYDPVPVPSSDARQRWNTACLTLDHLAGTDTEWVGWVQDDAVVCGDLVAGLEKALDLFPTGGLISPYTGTGRPDQLAARRALRTAEITKAAWLPLRSLYWGTCVVFPRSHARKVITFGNRNVFRYSPLDYITGVYFRDQVGWRTWYTMPSLTDHRDEDSLVGHDKPGIKRVAHTFIGAGASALEVDWTRTPRGGLDPALR